MPAIPCPAVFTVNIDDRGFLQFERLYLRAPEDGVNLLQHSLKGSTGAHGEKI